MSESEESVFLTTQKTLIAIRDVTVKIYRELNEINEMIRDKADVPFAVEHANNSLIRVAQELGIKSLNELIAYDENNDDLMNIDIIDKITEKLMSIQQR